MIVTNKTLLVNAFVFVCLLFLGFMNFVLIAPTLHIILEQTNSLFLFPIFTTIGPCIIMGFSMFYFFKKTGMNQEILLYISKRFNSNRK